MGRNLSDSSLEYVPVRSVCEELGAVVSWNTAEWSVEIRKKWN
jgi:hypothetical protein